MTKPADSEETGRIEALKSLRTTLDWLGDEVHSIQNEVDPVIEMTAITKAFDGSKALLAENIKGYPNVRMYSNLYATPEHQRTRACRPKPNATPTAPSPGARS